MVARQKRPLDLEQILRVPDVLAQRGLLVELGTRGDRSREDLHPGLEDGGVLGVELVQLDLTGVGVDGGLHRVAYVRHGLVDLRTSGLTGVEVLGVGGRALQRRRLRVREVVERGVAVDDPLDRAVLHDRRVGLGVDGQPRRDLLDAVPRVAVVDDLRRRGDLARQQEVPLRVLARIEESGEPVAQRDARGPW